LHEIHPEILRRELHFSAVGLLCLSNTDSMIESIRLALELEIPVYGVDLGEIANAERGQPFLPDPALARNGLVPYLARSAACSDSHGDAVVDGRRERVMAARLKRLLQQYRRVLFSGGLGHWTQLCRHLADASLRAALEPSRSEGETFTRVVVAPSLAIHQMDLFPDLAVCYEAVRRLPLEAEPSLMDYGAIYRAKLAAAWECAEPTRRDAAAAFSQYLTHLALVQQRRVPDLFMILHAARVMISPGFASRLGEALVTNALPWARPDQWPGLPYLSEVRPHSTTSSCSGPRAQLLSPDSRSAPFFLAHLASDDDRTAEWPLPPLADPAAEDVEPKPASIQCPAWVWPPCESLLFGTAYEGAAIAERRRRGPRPEPFAGSLYDGVDVKATLRALLRGERRVQVKGVSAAVSGAASGEAGAEPAVFLFERETAVTDGHWEPFLACYASHLRQLVRDKARFERVALEKGQTFIASVSFCAFRKPPAALQKHVADLCYLYGTVLFGNPCLNPLQSARWLEASDYSCCPILRGSGTGNLFDHYRREHNLLLDRDRWAASLIRLALPHAKRQVTVILPQAQTLPAAVVREAAARRIRLEPVPLSQFPKARIEAIRHQYLVRPMDVNAMKYSDELQAAFGQSPTAHLDLLPAQVPAQLDHEYGPDQS
jgi:hypothetical protein